MARTLAPAAVAVAGSALFLGGIPDAPPASGLGPAVIGGQPFVEVVGHYVPALRGPAGDVRVGAGPDADLRTTEPQVADDLGRLAMDGDHGRWRHGTTANDAAFYQAVNGPLPSVTSPPDALVPLVPPARIVWSDVPIPAEDLGRACVPAASGPWQGAKVDLVDATGLWLRDGRGDARTVELPAAEGQRRAVADGGLLWDGARLWATAGPPVAPPPEGSVMVATGWSRWWSGATGEVTSPPLDLGFLQAYGWGRVVPHPTGEVGLRGDRFVKPDTYVQINDAPPVAVGVTGSSPSVHPAFHVFRRRPRAESSVPWLWSVIDALPGSDDPRDLPRLGRAPGFGGHLYQCVADQAVPVGEADLASGDVLLAGRTTWALSAPEGHRVDLSVVEPPTHRVHALSSLSLGDLRTANRPLYAPDCAPAGTPARSLVLRGTTAESQLPVGVEAIVDAPVPAPGQIVERLPLPAWAARGHHDVQTQGALEVDLVELCVGADGDLRVLADRSPPGQPLLELHGGRIAHDATFGVAGHTLRYARHLPWLEQVLPIGAFALIVHALGLLAALRLARHTAADGTTAERHAPMLVIALFCAALTAGAALQLRMAASPTLLGSADYLQRHLLTGFLAAAGLLAAVDVGLGWPEEGAVARIRRLFASARLGATMLLAWLVFDRIAFQWLSDGPTPAGASVHGDLDRALLLVAAGAAFTWVAPLALRLAPVLRVVQTLAERLTVEIQRRRIAADDATVEVGASRWARARAFLVGALGAPGEAVLPLVVGVVILAAGVVIGGSGRSLGGFDLKLAEFAPLPVGLGLAGLLVRWSRVGSSFGRLAVVAGTLSWLGGLTLVVVVFYALRGDLGPLMVLVPAVFVTIAAWTVPWRAGRDDAHDTQERLVVLLGYAASVAAAFFVVYEAVPFVEAHITEIPAIGNHVERAVQRFATFGATWYTEGGHWSTTANWIAAGYFEGAEHYVSNLHSDLAFVAFMQSFHLVRALALLGLFAAIGTALLAMAESALARGEAAWREALPDAASDDREIRRRYHREKVPVFLEAGETGYFLVFVAAYLGCEVIVHIGTCFNTLPQTGITLPWISSGGSASVGFAILLGAALARLVRTGTRLDRTLG